MLSILSLSLVSYIATTGLLQSPHNRTNLLHYSATNNLLVDRDTQRITAILDFDWAQVSGVAEEFFRSFGNIYGELPGPYSNQTEQLALRHAFLQGFPNPLPSSEFDMPWVIAEAWDNELARSGAQRPRTIKGIAALSALNWLSDNICPFLLFNETIARQRSKEQSQKDKTDTEGLLIQFLQEHGY